MSNRKRICIGLMLAGLVAAAVALVPEAQPSGAEPAGHQTAAAAAEPGLVVAHTDAKFDYQAIRQVLDERPPMTFNDLHEQVLKVVGQDALPVLEELREQEEAWDETRAQQVEVHKELAAAIRTSDDRENDPEIQRLDAENNELLEQLATTADRISALSGEVTAMYEEAMYAQLDL